MKKLLMIVLSAGITTFSFAQNRSAVYADNRIHQPGNISAGNDDRSWNGNDRDRELASINSDFDRRAREIQLDRRMRDNEKRSMTTRLQRERNDRLRSCNEKFRKQDQQRGRGNSRNNNSSRRNQGSNGKF